MSLYISYNIFLSDKESKEIQEYVVFEPNKMKIADGSFLKVIIIFIDSY